ncbi:hypothetical protein HYH02_010300 [Chlamydomonas schloesseri]|uniref:DNA polymerase II subunit 2 n=1 Tax=Chlamydomonas schloesseri TaxID=2026947 RepID=A0A835W4M1_9CHLO|nr:hypothetical protein HYH02_010300 [Chlamydomonas schloesseri]|eukprot:KAG2440412.1 hypothetical protein HYH02_010300 [Chlamydomonas schloesseri]
MSFALKKAIKKELLNTDWAGKVEEPAVAAFADVIEQYYAGQLSGLHDILKRCTTELSADGKITVATVQAAAAPTGVAEQVELIELTDAFSVPRLVYDPVQRKLNVDSKPRRLHANAEAKHQVYLQRLQLVQQRLQRSRMFQQSNLILPNSSNSHHSVQLTDLQSLMGVFGVTRYVLGCISRAEDGRYLLEDTTGTVPLDLDGAETAAGFYTENCVVIAEGALGHDGAFHVRALGLPPCEPRSALPLAAQRLNLWGGPGGAVDPGSEVGGFLALEEAQRGAADRVVVLANVWLDRPEVMDALHTVLGGFSGVLTVPAVFVFMGNFHSRAGGGTGAGGGGRGDGMLGGCDVDYGVMRELFGQLGTLIDNYPRLKAESRFVFMPGPDDAGPAGVLPQPPLPRALTSELRRVLPTAQFASNPCRLRYATQRIVLFRHDLQRRLLRRTLLPLAAAPDSAATQQPGSVDAATQASAGPSPAALWGHTSLTLLQQGHLAPLPLLAQPVYWQYDSAMGLYPLPDAVILADGSAAQEEFVHEGCRVINPGTFPGGFFAAYLPCVQQTEMSELPRPGQEQDDEEEEEEEEGAQGAAGGDAGGEDGAMQEGIEGMEGIEEPGAAQQHRAGRVPLQQRQLQQQQQQQRGEKEKKGAGKSGKPRQPRKAAAAAGGGGSKGRQATIKAQQGAAAAEPGGEEDVAEAGDGAEAAADGADADVQMVEGEADGEGAAAAAAGPKAKGKAKGKAAAAAVAAAAAAPAAKRPKQGTLAQAWAKRPARPEAGLEDEVPQAGGRGGDGDVVMVDDEEDEEEAGEEAAAARRRQQQQARKRRAMVMEDEEGDEDEEEGAEEGTGGGNGAAGAKAAARTWADDDDEQDWVEDGE